MAQFDLRVREEPDVPEFGSNNLPLDDSIDGQFPDCLVREALAFVEDGMVGIPDRDVLAGIDECKDAGGWNKHLRRGLETGLLTLGLQYRHQQNFAGW
jgi:hypothetical protein